MQIKVDLRIHTPIYLQIMQQIRKLVLQGGLHPGDQLPTVRQLAYELEINFNTVARAYRLLDKAGLISTQHGRGTFVLDFAPAVHEGFRQDILANLTAQYLEEATKFDFSLREVAQAFAGQVRQLQQKASADPPGEQDEETSGPGEKRI
ncbi:MAG: GntR family transcriptional regulator [Anaerolineaceae bacterium]|nr:GntR family transcriptional regulator [Anaerolineaceae bacterium]